MVTMQLLVQVPLFIYYFVYLFIYFAFHVNTIIYSYVAAEGAS